MIKMSLRRLCLGGAAFALAVLSLLCLLFAPVGIDLSQFDGILQDNGLAFMRTVEENGFALLDGKSDVIAIFKEFAIIWSSSAGANYFMPSLHNLEVFSQVFNILILVCSSVLCILVIIWIFFAKSEGIVKVTAILSIWIGVIYLIEGVLFVICLNTEWKSLLNKTDESLSLFIGNIFTTYAYIPLLLIIVLEITFWCFYYKVECAQPKCEEKISSAQDEVAVASDQMEQDYFERLKKLLDLYDEEVLT